MVAIPELPVATEIGFAKVPVKPPINVALLLPPESPMVIAPVPDPPKALALVVPSTVPDRIVRPPVNVLAPERTSMPFAFMVIEVDPPKIIDIVLVPLVYVLTITLAVPAARVAAPANV